MLVTLAAVRLWSALATVAADTMSTGASLTKRVLGGLASDPSSCAQFSIPDVRATWGLKGGKTAIPALCRIMIPAGRAN